jgi:deazaflavin-dependent oxidoreductase (nitroreductase family)
MSAVQTMSPARQPGGVRRAARFFNVFIARFAGTRWMPLYGIITHQGRRSGRMFHTPVVVRPTVDGFIVPMPWGEGTDWYRNVRAAGGCVIRWKGQEYEVEQPEVLDVHATTAFDPFQRRMMARFGIKQALRLRRRQPAP